MQPSHILELTYHENDILIVLSQLRPNLEDVSIITLEGSLGAGKTTLLKLLLKEMGVKDTITSPTFSYVNRYVTTEGKTIYHFDLYRITDLQSFLNAGFDEYLADQQALSIIEWPEVIRPLLKHYRVCAITLEYIFTDLHMRKLRMSLLEREL